MLGFRLMAFGVLIVFFLFLIFELDFVIYFPENIIDYLAETSRLPGYLFSPIWVGF